HQNGAVVRKGFFQICFQPIRVVDGDTPDAHGLRYHREIGVLHIHLEVGQSHDLHFQLDHAQASVVEHDDPDGKVVLFYGCKVAEQHGDTAISAHRDDFAVGAGQCRADG